MSRKSLAIFAAAAAALAATPAAHAVGYFVPGSYQTPTAWTPETAPLMDDQGGGIFTLSLTGLTPATEYKYKVLFDDNDVQAWSDQQITPNDLWFLPDAGGEVTVRYNEGTGKVSFLGDWTPQLVGSFQSETVDASPHTDWNPDDNFFNMTPKAGSPGVFTYSGTISTPGTYNMKTTAGNGWDQQFGTNGFVASPVSATEFTFTTANANQEVVFEIDTLEHLFSVTGVVPTPPTWKFDSAGDWHNENNWLVAVPNGVDAHANFDGAIFSPRTVYNDGPVVTVGKMTFNNANTYHITGASEMVIESAGTAVIDVVQGTHKINLPLTFASNTNLNVAGGATLKISDPVTINSGATVSEINSGTVSYESTVTLQPAASLTMASSQRMAALSIGDDSTATMAASGGSKVLRTTVVDVSTAGGKLDLKDNSMVTKTSLSSVVAQVKDALGDGTWNGTNGITTSMPAAAAGTTTLAVANAGAAGKTTFAGESVAANDTLVMYTFNGDANLSGNVDADDYFIIDSSYGQIGVVPTFIKGDFNYDGVIDGDDFAAIDAGFSGQFAPAASAGVSAVPEPAGLSLAAVAALAALGRRRRQA